MIQGSRAGRVPRSAGYKGLLARASRLASPEGRQRLAALLLLLEVDARLRLAGFARLRAALRWSPGASESGIGREAEMEDVQRMAAALRWAASYVPRARCLHRALSLLLWLRRRGVAAELCMGVRPLVLEDGLPAPATIEGHAWVEWNGVPLDEERAICETFGRFEPARRGRFPDRLQGR